MRKLRPSTNSHRIRVSKGRSRNRQHRVTDRLRRRHRHSNWCSGCLPLVLSASENKSLFIARGWSNQPKSCHIMRGNQRPYRCLSEERGPVKEQAILACFTTNAPMGISPLTDHPRRLCRGYAQRYLTHRVMSCSEGMNS